MCLSNNMEYLPLLSCGRRTFGSAQGAICLVVLSLLALPAFGQRASLGIVIGGHANSDFDARYIPNPPYPPTIFESDSGGYLVGPSLDVRLLPRLSIGAEALYRPLHYRQGVTIASDGSVLGYAPATVVTWQFPILARYRFSSGGLTPLVEGGPSFRSAGNLNLSSPSRLGVTAGAGLEMTWRRLTIAPRVRYTRWVEDSWSTGIRTRSDQVELLTSFSYAPTDNAHPLGRRISLGVVIGPDLSGGSKTTTRTFPDPYNGTPITVRDTLRPGRLVLGPLIELSVSSRFTIEGNAIASSRVNKYTTTWQGQVRKSSSSWAQPWEFPALVKYRLLTHSVRPFLAAGPTLRLPNGAGGDKRSIYGLTAGGGLEIRARRIRFSPTVRYTRWGPDRVTPSSGESLNRLYLLVGVAF